MLHEFRRISIGELQHIFDQHAIWLETGFSNGFRADFSGADLNGIDLNGCDLRRIDFSGADLRGAILNDADLRDTDLRAAHLTRAQLQNADLRRADLWRAKVWESDLCGANLDRAILSEAVMYNANLSDTCLTGADLWCTDLRMVHFVNADLSNHKETDKHSILTGAKLYGIEKTGWNISGIICEYAYWDKLGEVRTNYESGVFEKEFA